jgi:hypothetical protein
MPKRKRNGGFKTRIWKATGTNAIRLEMQCAHVSNGYIYATNAYVLIRQKLDKVHQISEEEIKHLEGKLLHRELLKELERYEYVRFEADGIYASKVGVICRFEYSADLKFPNCDAVIPNGEWTDGVSHIGVNAKLLSLVTECMSQNTIGHKLTFSGTAKGIVITGPEFSREEELGLIMPTRVES